MLFCKGQQHSHLRRNASIAKRIRSHFFYFFSSFSFLPFLSHVSGISLLSSIEIAVRDISFCWVHTEANGDQAIWGRLRLTENLDEFRHESYFFYYRDSFISNSLDNFLCSHGLQRNTLEVMGGKLPRWFFSAVELKYLSGKLSAHLQPT